MPKSDAQETMRKQLATQQARVRHLENELRLVREENLRTKDEFFDIYFNMEAIIKERTRDLAASENRFRQMAEAISEVYWMATIDFDSFLYVSPSFSNLWNHTEEELYRDASLWLDRIDREDLPSLESNRTKVRSGNPVYEEFRLRSPDGSVRWIANSSYPIAGEEGRVTSVTGIARDITDKMRTGEILLQAKKDWEATFDAIPDCICILDEEHRITRMNKAMAGRLGKHPADCVGSKCCTVLCDGQDNSCCALINATAHSIDPLEIPLDQLGGWFLVTSSLLPAESGTSRRHVLVFRDITRRRNAESRYRQLFQRASSGMFRADHVGKFIRVNPALAAMLGYETVSECLKQCPSLPELFLDSRLPEIMRERLAKRGEIVGLETQLRRKDDEPIWVRINARATEREQTGECCEGFIEDITERRQAEQSLAQSQRLEAMGILAGGIAHDFNNILGAIIGYTDLALAESTPEELKRDNLRHVLAAGRRARDLVKQILTFSRSSTQSIGAVDLVPVIKETLRFLRSSLPSLVRIEQRLPAATGRVLMSPAKLHQVIMNLCTNAVQAMQVTGGVLRVELSEVPPDQARSLDLGLESLPHVMLRISDTGIGMDEKTKTRIFEPYFTTKKVGEGTGMGLAVVHGIVISHGGGILVDSTPGQGASFSIYLPISNKTSREADTEEPLAEVMGQGERILVVDDEKDLVSMLKQMLTSLGYEALGAHSSPLALQLFKADPDMFDLVITDQTMPNMTGVDIARSMSTIRPELPVILCTGYGGISVSDKTPDNIRCILDKPLEKGTLSQIIRQCLAGSSCEDKTGEVTGP